jgi:1-acyl-sn-glycerol-3-phosphate acyltransferase
MPAWFDRWFYQFTRIPLFTSATLAFSFRYEGGRNVPASGPALMLANHESFLDPPLIGLTTTRPLHFLARKSLFKPGFGELIRKLNAVPVDQEGVAKEGLKTIIDLLREGKAVVVFPEGERTWDGEMLSLKPGIQLIIRKTRAPIVPVGIVGAFEALPRTRAWPQFSPLFMPANRGSIAISIGKPIDSTPYVDMEREQMLTELQGAIQAMKDRAMKLKKKV